MTAAEHSQATFPDRDFQKLETHERTHERKAPLCGGFLRANFHLFTAPLFLAGGDGAARKKPISASPPFSYLIRLIASIVATVAPNPMTHIDLTLLQCIANAFAIARIWQ